VCSGDVSAGAIGAGAVGMMGDAAGGVSAPLKGATAIKMQKAKVGRDMR
jgi:hypothetical protein